MKTTTSTLLAMHLLFAALAAPADHGRIHAIDIILSSYYRAEDLVVIRDDLLRFIEKAEPGTEINMFDGDKLVRIATLQIPKLKYPSPQALQIALGPSLVPLLRWFETAKTANTGPLKDTAAINVIEAMHEITARPATSPRAILIIGPPFYYALGAPTWSLVPFLFPADQVVLTNSLTVPYGTLDKRGRLTNCLVHWCYLHEPVWQNRSDYKGRVRRFWALWFATHQSGKLVNFSADLKTILTQLTQPDLPPVPVDTPREGRLCMNYMPPPAETNAWQQIFTNPSSAPMALPPELGSKRGVGLAWDVPCDIDLYLTPRPGGEELSFKRTLAPGGIYYHDYTHATAGKWEFVELTSPNAQLSEVEAWANIYGGGAPAVRGRVVVLWQGHAYYGTFSIAATNGNGGAAHDQRSTSPHWTKLDLTRIVGLSQ